MFYIIIVLNRPQFFFYFSPFFLHYLFIYIFILWKTINLVHYKNISFKYIKIINKVFFFFKMKPYYQISRSLKMIIPI